MDIEAVRLYALSLFEVKEDMPYGPDWLVFRIGGKIFLHIWLEAPEPTCAVKLPPEQGAWLRANQEGVRPAYHLNKIHWNDLFLDHLSRKEVEQLIRMSYQQVYDRLPKHVKADIERKIKH